MKGDVKPGTTNDHYKNYKYAGDLFQKKSLVVKLYYFDSIKLLTKFKFIYPGAFKLYEVFH